MKQEINPVTAAIVIGVVVIVLLGLGWKLFLAPPSENLPAPPGVRPPLTSLPGGTSPTPDPTTRVKPVAPK